MLGRDRKPSIDVNRMIAAAMSAFMAPGQEAGNGRPKPAQSRDGGHGLGSIGAVAVGAALAVTARAAYSRARREFDLVGVADAVEQRLND